MKPPYRDPAPSPSAPEPFCRACGAPRCVECLRASVCGVCLDRSLVERERTRVSRAAVSAERASPSLPSRRAAARSALLAGLLFGVGALTGIVSAHRAASPRHREPAPSATVASPAPPAPPSTEREAPPPPPPPPLRPAEPVAAALCPPDSGQSPPAPGMRVEPGSRLASLGRATRDPRVLAARAWRLADAGADVEILRSRRAPGERPHEVFAEDPAVVQTRARPYYVGARPVGLAFTEVWPESLVGRAGVRSGDIVVAINGRALDSPERALAAYARLGTSRLAVLEVVRGETLVVLVTEFREASASRLRPRAPVAAPPRESAPRRSTGSALGVSRDEG